MIFLFGMQVTFICDYCLICNLSLMIVVSFQPAPYETNLYDTKLTCFISTVLGQKITCTYDQNGGLRPVSPGNTNTTVIKKVVTVSQ